MTPADPRPLFGRKLAGSALAAGWILAVLVGACSDDSEPPPASTSVGTEAGASDAQAAGDAVVITNRPELCMGLARGGDPIPEVELLGDPPPPLGGTVAPGTYDLDQLNVYAGTTTDGGVDDDQPSSRLTGQAAQISVVVTDNSLRFVEARGTMTDQVVNLSAETTRAVLYRTDGTSLVVTPVCPTTAGPSPIPFSAVGGGLAIFTDAKHRELYVLRR